MKKRSKQEISKVGKKGGEKEEVEEGGLLLFLGFCVVFD